MDDLISRQKVVDILNNAKWEYDISPDYEDGRTDIERFADWYEMIKICIVGMVENLPFAIHCKSCRHYIPYEWMYDGTVRSHNISDYKDSEIGCEVNDRHYPPDGFCSNAEVRK